MISFVVCYNCEFYPASSSFCMVRGRERQVFAYLESHLASAGRSTAVYTIHRVYWRLNYVLDRILAQLIDQLFTKLKH